MKKILAEEYLDSLTRVRVMLDIQTLQLSLLVSRHCSDGKGMEQEQGPFDSIGALRDGLRRLFDGSNAWAAHKKAGARPAFRLPDVGAA